MGKLTKYLIIGMMSIIALGAIILTFSEPSETLQPKLWWSTLVWTKVIGVGLFVFLYYSFKWMVKYSRH